MAINLIDKIKPKNDAFNDIVDALNAGVSTTNFSGNLSSADNTVQKALDTIDDLTLGGGAVDSVNSQTGTVVLDADDISDTSTTNKFATATELSKLAGIETGAEVNNISDTNATDLTDSGASTLHYHTADRDRANHTGTQAASTISDFDTEVSNNTDVSANTSARHDTVTISEDETCIVLTLDDQELKAEIDDYCITYEKMSPTVSTRMLLQGATTYYVATTGSDSTGDGSSGSPWATIQYAVNYCSANVDMGVYSITIQLADGTYTESITAKNINGAGSVTIQGNTGDQTAVIINSPGTNFNATGVYTGYNLRYLKLRTSGSNAVAIGAYNLSPAIDARYITIDGTGSSGNYNYVVVSQTYSVIRLRDITWGGTCGAFLRGQTGRIQFYSTSLTLSGTCAWSTAFILLNELANVLATSFTYSGSATGKRYSQFQSSGTRTGSASATYFPGDTAGTDDGTGYYG